MFGVNTMQKLKCLVLFLFITCLMLYTTSGRKVNRFKSYEGYKVFSILPGNKYDLKKISRIFKNPYLDVWKSTKKVGIPTDVMVPPNIQEEFIRKLNRNELTYNITLDNVQRVTNNERNQLQKQRKKHKNGMKFTTDVYFGYKQINNYLNYLQTEYPDLIKIIKYGKSFEGRDLNVAHISSNFSKTENPTILIDGGIHARERISPAQVLYIIYQLVELNDENEGLIENIDWYLIPVINPDGYVYTFTRERYWRKTRSTFAKECTGVDANRNFGYNWRNEIGVCNELFPGKTYFTEPETIALAKFGESIKKQLKLYLTFHSFGELILYPWSHTTQEAPKNYEELKAIGKELERLLGRKYKSGTPGEVIYDAYGSSMDWFKGVLNVDLVFAIELSPDESGYIDGEYVGFALTPNKIEAVVSNGFKGVKYLGEYVSKKYVTN